jgi:hypothetical protein
MIAAYIVAAVIYLTYTWSLWSRTRAASRRSRDPDAAHP